MKVLTIKDKLVGKLRKVVGKGKETATGNKTAKELSKGGK